MRHNNNNTKRLSICESLSFLCLNSLSYLGQSTTHTHTRIADGCVFAFLVCASVLFVLFLSEVLSVKAFPILIYFSFFLLHLDMFGEARFLFQGECRSMCPEGFFNSARNLCEPCRADCIICGAAAYCLRCSPGHKLRNGQCILLECNAGEREHCHYERPSQ